MSQKRLLWQLFPYYFLITLFALIALSFFLSQSFKDVYLQQTARDLEIRAKSVESEITLTNSINDLSKLSQVCKDLRSKTETRITITDPEGVVLADTDEDPARMDNHKSRPEIQRAILGEVGQSTRYSNTLRQNLMYVAIPLRESNRAVAVVRVALPITAIDEILHSITIHVIWAAVLIAAISGAVSYWISKKLSQPLEEMKQGVDRFARGELDHRLSISDVGELGSVAEAMNIMANQLDERIRAVIQQRAEQEAVLASMVEGVIAIDSDEKILSFNAAAAQLFGVSREQSLGRSLQETIRNTDLQKFVRKAISQESALEGEIRLFDDEEKFLQVHGSVLRDAKQKKIGALIVFNDVTRLRKLENVRRDFVANVSHELKTPITSIKGFVETLLDGDSHNAQDTQRFLQIIATQADRLNSIIEDLLSLSRIEQEAETGNIETEISSIKDVVQSAVQNCEHKLSEKKIQVQVECDPKLRAKVNPQLLEQAVINLLDNAIKYSEPQRDIFLTAIQEDGELQISVRDQGFGIEKQHLDRIFERFYRVDKGRSRKMGGTGLGLAIVKHIVQAHQGSIDVESNLGKGSTFILRIPNKS